MSKQVQVITEEDLLKSIRDVAGIKEEPENQEVKREVRVVAAPTSAAEILETRGSEGLQKALEVSEVLGEFTGLMTEAVDGAITVLTKSIQDAAERDDAIVTALVALKKSIDENTKAVEKYGAQPAAPANSSSLPAGGKVVMLAKATDTAVAGKVEMSPAELRGKISAGLESMAKALPRDSADLGAITRAAVKFESTGEISDIMLQKALRAAGVEGLPKAAAA